MRNSQQPTKPIKRFVAMPPNIPSGYSNSQIECLLASIGEMEPNEVLSALIFYYLSNDNSQLSYEQRAALHDVAGLFFSLLNYERDFSRHEDSMKEVVAASEVHFRNPDGSLKPEE